MKLTDLAGQPVTTVAEQITKSQAALHISDEALAEQAELPHPRMITMIKSGKMKLPLGMVRQVAQAIELEPGTLMRLALDEVEPGLSDEIEQCMGPLTLTPGEARLIMKLREQAKGRDFSPVMFSGDSVVALIAA